MSILITNVFQQSLYPLFSVVIIFFNQNFLLFRQKTIVILYLLW